MSSTAVIKKPYTATVELGQFWLLFYLARTLQNRNTEVTVCRRGTAVSLERKWVRYGCKILASWRTLSTPMGMVSGTGIWFQNCTDEGQRWNKDRQEVRSEPRDVHTMVLQKPIGKSATSLSFLCQPHYELRWKHWSIIWHDYSYTGYWLSVRQEVVGTYEEPFMSWPKFCSS